MLKKLLKKILSWNEFLTLPMALLLWFYSEDLLRLLDSQAATFDQGILQIPIFATICFLFMHSVVWIVIRIAFPFVYKFIDDVIGKNIMSQFSPKNPSYQLTLWQRTISSLWLFSLYFLLAVLSLLAAM